MKKGVYKFSALLIPAAWFAATSMFSVVVLDLIMTDSALIHESFVERLHFSKDIFIMSAAVISGALVGGLFYKRILAKGLGD